MLKICRLLFLFIMLISFANISHAQVLGNGGSKKEPVKSNSSNPSQKTSNPSKTNPSWLSNPRRVPPKASKPKDKGYVEVTKDNVEELHTKEVDNSLLPSKTPKKQRPKTQPKKEKEYIPQKLRPTLDGSRRGGVSMQPVAENPDVDDRFIFVYYTNFDIRVSLTGSVMCDVRFIVLSTLDRRINNVSMRLNWEGMSTTLSYNSVDPNVETYFDYTLIGKGCYTMDKAPNIIVNRCRVAGMSQVDCAKKIHWLRK